MVHWLAAPEISLFFPQRGASDALRVSRLILYLDHGSDSVFDMS